MTDLIPFIDPVSIAPHVPDAPDTPDAPSWTPPFVKKVTITDRDDAYLAALLDNKVAEILIDKHRSGLEHNLKFDIEFEGDNIFGLTPPIPTSTREWLLLALAAKLNAPAQSVKIVHAPVGLESSASLEAVISKVNSIISALIEAGVFSRDQNPVVK